MKAVNVNDRDDQRQDREDEHRRDRESGARPDALPRREQLEDAGGPIRRAEERRSHRRLDGPGEEAIGLIGDEDEWSPGEEHEPAGDDKQGSHRRQRPPDRGVVVRPDHVPSQVESRILEVVSHSSRYRSWHS
jgi:hypothetical protein